MNRNSINSENNQINQIGKTNINNNLEISKFEQNKFKLNRDTISINKDKDKDKDGFIYLSRNMKTVFIDYLCNSLCICRKTKDKSRNYKLLLGIKRIYEKMLSVDNIIRTTFEIKRIQSFLFSNSGYKLEDTLNFKKAIEE